MVKKLIVIGSVLTVILLVLAGFIYFRNYTDGEDGDILKIYLYIYKNGEAVVKIKINSPTENFGKLFSKWFIGYTTQGTAVTVSLKRVDGQFRTVYIDDIYTLANYHFGFVAINDSNALPFQRSMYNYKNANSDLVYLPVSTSGYFEDANGNLVVYIQSQQYSVSQAKDFEAIAFYLSGTNPSSYPPLDGETYLLIYDVLNTPISLNAGDTLQLELRFTLP